MVTAESRPERRTAAHREQTAVPKMAARRHGRVFPRAISHATQAIHATLRAPARPEQEGERAAAHPETDALERAQLEADRDEGRGRRDPSAQLRTSPHIPPTNATSTEASGPTPAGQLLDRLLSIAFMTETIEHRVSKAGYPPGTAGRLCAERAEKARAARLSRHRRDGSGTFD
jgi:hypothetical protein